MSIETDGAMGFTLLKQTILGNVTDTDITMMPLARKPQFNFSSSSPNMSSKTWHLNLKR
jgi:hypothetical protein